MIDARTPTASVLGFLALLLAVPVTAEPTSGCLAGRDAATSAGLVKVGARTFANKPGGMREVNVTADCLSCHDGTVGKVVSVRDVRGANRGGGAIDFLAASSTFPSNGLHPVDIVYPEGKKGFRPLFEVQEKLPLGGGRVTCTTCHSGTDSRNAYLSISNERSALCTTCHVK